MLNHDQTRKEPHQFGLLQAANTCTPSADGIVPVRSFITERKYEQIMSCTENDLHHFTAAGKVVDRSAAELVNYSIRHKRKSSSSSINPGDVEEYHRKTIIKKAKRLVTRSSSSPGSNSSDVTTEQYMAESSKSNSCFDDACTLAPDQAPPAADAADAAAAPVVSPGGPPEETIDIDQSGASTSEPIHKSCNDDDRHHQVSDLNGVPVLAPHQQQPQTAEIGNFSRHQMVDLLLKSEESELLGINNRRSFMNQAEAAGECIEYYSSSNSWLQLGLGISSSSRGPEVLPKTTTANKPHELLVADYSAAEEDEEVDVSRQQKQVLHLFPSESVQIPEYASPGQALASKQLTSATTSSARSGEIDQPLAIASSDFHGLGRFGRAAAEESRGRQQELTGFLKSLKESPDTELVISFNNNTSTSTTTGYAVHAADDHEVQFRQQIRSPPQLISSSARLMMNSFGDQSYYQESASDQVQQHGGYASTSSYDQFNVSFPQQQQQLQQPFEDSRHSIQRGYNSTAAAAKSRSQQQDSSSHLWPKRDQSLTTPYFTPSRAPDVFVPMQAASPFHTAASRLNLPSQQSEDWQTLIKRLGGSNMQFQSFFNPGMTKASADGFLEEMQQQRRRNLQDLQAHWNSTSQETPARSISHAAAAAGSGAAAPWSRQLLTGSGTQDISIKTTMPFSFPSFDGLSFSSRVAAPNLQAWPPSVAGSLLPFLPNISHDQQQQHHQFFPDHLTTTDQRRKLTPVNDHDIWFFLRAGAANQDSLPQIPKGYLRVKDGGTVPVSHVKKYLVHKLGLSCESEVEISCRGHILSSSLSLQHVRDVIWHSSTATTATTTAEETSSSRNIVMELNYSKRLLQFHHS